MKFLLLAAILVLFNHGINARHFERCDLARELKSRGVRSSDLANWVCTAKYESSFNTQAMNRDNDDGSWDWGLFQINDRYWCNPGDGRRTENVCGINCKELLSDDIGTALNCALKIHGIHNFGAWVAFKDRCSNGRAESVEDCFVGNLENKFMPQFGMNKFN